MAAVTLLGTATFDTASGTKTVTATPAVNDLIVIITSHSDNTSAATPTDDQSGTYVEITSAVKLTGADTMRAFIRTALIPSAVSTVFTHAPGTSSGGGLAVLKVTGMSRTGASAARQSAKQDNQAASTTPAPMFASAVLTGNPVIGAVCNRSNPAGLTPPTSYTNRVNAGYNTPTNGLDVVSRDSGETGTTITWGSTSTAFGSLVLELDTSSGAITGDASNTLGALTLVAAAALALAAESAPTLDAATLSADGAVAIQAESSNTLGAATLSADALLDAKAADADITLGAVTASADGSVAIQAESAPTLGAVASSADGSIAIVADFSKTLGAATLSSASSIRTVVNPDIQDTVIRAVQWGFGGGGSNAVSGWTGARTAVADPWRAKWRARVELAVVQGESGAAPWRAFIAKRKGKFVPFRLAATAGAQNSNTGVTVASTAAAGATSMSLSGYATALTDGQLFTVNHQLLCATADQSGATVTFEPPLRQSAAAGAAVNTHRPYALMHLIGARANWSVGPQRLFNFAFDCEEAILETDGQAAE